jgi:hypothetical protein
MTGMSTITDLENLAKNMMRLSDPKNYHGLPPFFAEAERRLPNLKRDLLSKTDEANAEKRVDNLKAEIVRMRKAIADSNFSNLLYASMHLVDLVAKVKADFRLR